MSQSAGGTPNARAHGLYGLKSKDAFWTAWSTHTDKLTWALGFLELLIRKSDVPATQVTASRGCCVPAKRSEPAGGNVQLAPVRQVAVPAGTVEDRPAHGTRMTGGVGKGDAAAE
jgi:hypothetical protein